MEGNFIHKVNYHSYGHFPDWNLCSYLKEQRACLLKEEEKAEFSK
jgi:hypothetical protein